ncbi:uncharacterized protein LOC106168566 [Lingula anatina]|uniref:Uncharacterized protein LOC106168566 n=1 Tax=Lingula anatina TaxID=7574 RepID=A0A1S3IYP9_LINAN|nr:uncharacterized protein LOC106168566 [Lingula anatina]|eukprot:XP_013403138.1 uncharacterized protein LOC106168566 [Lingula anatina]
MGWKLTWIVPFWSVFIAMANSLQLPKFEDLKAHYPGYRHYGGKYSDTELYTLIGRQTKHWRHNTSSLRLSYTLNTIGGRHAVVNHLPTYTVQKNETIRGKDNHRYIFRAIASGPFLAAKYESPVILRLHSGGPDVIAKFLMGKQGIVRLLTFRERTLHADGHMALWDCDHFHQIKDFSRSHHIIAVELWQTPDSHCPVKKQTHKKHPRVHINSTTYKFRSKTRPKHHFKHRAHSRQ